MIKNPQDFYLGLIYLVIGLSAMYFSGDYSYGTAGRMGPGYFPWLVSLGLSLVALASLVRSMIRRGEPVTSFDMRGLILITGGIALFAFLLPLTGLVVALLVLFAVSAMASREFRLEWFAAAGMCVFTAACVLVFVKGLGLPIPIVGSWLAPYASIVGF